MKTLRTILASALALTVAITAGCEDSDSPAGPGEDGGLTLPNVVRVTAGHQEFVVGAQQIPSGWTTFEFVNESDSPHFMSVERMPTFEGEQKTVQDSRQLVVPVFQNFMDDFRGETPSFPDAGFELPPWYGDVVFTGGPGLTSPGETSWATLNLAPGTYIIECYVKTADGTFHVTNDMITGLTVTEQSAGAAPPSEVTARVTISSANGITVDGDVAQAGPHTFEVVFADQMAYSHFLGHDAHLVRLQGVDVGELAAWMNWVVPGSLAGSVPGGAVFVGGTQDMPAGSRTFVTAQLEAGDYAWIAEVPEPGDKDMLVEFTVP